MKRPQAGPCPPATRKPKRAVSDVPPWEVSASSRGEGAVETKRLASSASPKSSTRAEVPRRGNSAIGRLAGFELMEPDKLLDRNSSGPGDIPCQSITNLSYQDTPPTTTSSAVVGEDILPDIPEEGGTGVLGLAPLQRARSLNPLKEEALPSGQSTSDRRLVSAKSPVPESPSSRRGASPGAVARQPPAKSRKVKGSPTQQEQTAPSPVSQGGEQRRAVAGPASRRKPETRSNQPKDAKRQTVGVSIASPTGSSNQTGARERGLLAIEKLRQHGIPIVDSTLGKES